MKLKDLKNKLVEIFFGNSLSTRTTNNIDISAELAKKILEKDKNAILLDVRSIAEYNEGHISGAVVITNYELEKDMLRFITNKDETILAYCTTGSRSKKAVKLLRRLGYINAYNIIGGLDNWD